MQHEHQVHVTLRRRKNDRSPRFFSWCRIGDEWQSSVIDAELTNYSQQQWFLSGPSEHVLLQTGLLIGNWAMRPFRVYALQLPTHLSSIIMQYLDTYLTAKYAEVHEMQQSRPAQALSQANVGACPHCSCGA